MQEANSTKAGVQARKEKTSTDPKEVTDAATIAASLPKLFLPT